MIPPVVPSPVSLAVAGIGLADSIGLQINDLIQSTGCGSTCTDTTKVVNTAQTTLSSIQRNYWGIPAPRPRLAQTQALADIDVVFAWVMSQCNNPAMGDAGQRCISERLVPGGSAPWCPGGTGCDWYTAYRVPIQNDPAVSDSVAGGLGTSQGPINLPINTLDGQRSGGVVLATTPNVQTINGSVQLRDLTSTAGDAPGDRFQLIVHGTPGAAVEIDATHDGQALGSSGLGTIDASGTLIVAGTWDQSNIGRWLEHVYVGGQLAGTITFEIAARAAGGILGGSGGLNVPGLGGLTQAQVLLAAVVLAAILYFRE